MNRELKNAAHLNKYINKETTVKLFAKNEETGNKSFNAILKEFSDENYKFNLIPDNKLIVLTKKEVAHIYSYDEFAYDEINI